MARNQRGVTTRSLGTTEINNIEHVNLPDTEKVTELASLLACSAFPASFKESVQRKEWDWRGEGSEGRGQIAVLHRSECSKLTTSQGLQMSTPMSSRVPSYIDGQGGLHS